MKKLLLLFCISSLMSCQFGYAQFPAVTKTPMHPVTLPAANQLIQISCPVSNTDMWFASLMNPAPNDTFCLGTTNTDYIEFWNTIPDITHYRYFHHDTAGIFYDTPQWTPAADHIYVPVDVGASYIVFLMFVKTNGDTCMSQEYGFSFVEPDPPYNCLPLSNLNVFPNPITAGTNINYSYTSAEGGSGTFSITRINGRWWRRSVPHTTNFQGFNNKCTSTRGMPSGEYELKVTQRNSVLTKRFIVQ